MSITLPPETHEIWAYVSRGAIDASLSGNSVKTLPHISFAYAQAQRQFKADRKLKKIFSLATDSQGSLVLARFGCRGGKRVIWNFGIPDGDAA